MLATTNRLTDEREFLELQPFEVQVEIAQENHELATSREIRLAQLADIRIEIEQRGIWQELREANAFDPDKYLAGWHEENAPKKEAPAGR